MLRARNLVRLSLLAAALAVIAALGVKAGAEPVLHEYIAPNPSEDLKFAATALRGSMPAALNTPSGVISAPEVGKPLSDSETAYGGGSTPNSTDATYRIDRDTSRPDLVRYDDPFVPAITPFKRLYAFDAVDDQLELVVRDKTLRALPAGNDATASDDQFYADMSVDLANETPVRIPSVGPGTRVQSAETEPQVSFELLSDAADNWFIRARVRQRVRLLMHLAVPRASFGSDFAEVSWSSLERLAPALPASVRQAAADVISELGITRSMGPRAAVATLVQHFRAFAPSDDQPRAEGAALLYKELALSRKGVCRHRAYAFTITALGLGIPARMIRNEAHAWVEVFDGRIWHRIDLGGAAGRLDLASDPGTRLHQPPADPYRWPESAESAHDAVLRSLGNGAGSRPGGPEPGAASTSDTADAAAAPANPEPRSEPDLRPKSRLILGSTSGEARRGSPLTLRGSLEADGSGCSYARVDVSLEGADKRLVAIGALATDASGHFDGSVTIPLSIAVGDYDIVASTPGDSRCGPGQSR